MSLIVCIVLLQAGDCFQKKSRKLILPSFIILFVITGCASHKASKRPDYQPPRKIRGYSDVRGIEKRIRDEFKRWNGTQHRLGGIGQKGIDCSGFVKEIYKKLFNIELPRITKDQAKVGVPIGWGELQAGDLVFFKPPTYLRHVGIYLSGDEFVHASVRKGVTISHIDSYYWGKYCWTARRTPLY